MRVGELRKAEAKEMSDDPRAKVTSLAVLRSVELAWLRKELSKPVSKRVN